MRWAIEKGLNDQHVYHRELKSGRPKDTYKDRWKNQRKSRYYDGNNRCSLYVLVHIDPEASLSHTG